jgi:lysophospholipase L1-like esterase
MKKIFLSLLLLLFLCKSTVYSQQAETSIYLDSIKTELQKQWPANRAINLVFHGHSVPSGYFKTPDVRTLLAYPQLTLASIKEKYPYAVVNSIVTAIGGENSEQGAARFDSTVLIHKPDVLFIDYALNDRHIGLSRAKTAWETMIEKAIALNIKIILLTPTPDWSENILDEDSPLAQHSRQIRELAARYNIGLVDSYAAFQTIVRQGEKIEDFMSQINHPNEKGHKVVEKMIMIFF